MSIFIPPVSSLPAAQPATQAPTPQQAPTAAQAAAAVTAVPVGTTTRQAASAAGNNSGAAAGKREKGSKSDNAANATEARTNGPRPRGMGRKADLSV